MVAAFPAIKLFGLIFKQLSKPIAERVKAKAKTSYFCRTYLCMPPAQLYHWCDVKMKMWAMNLGKPVSIPKLNETMAIELGASLLGEAIIFSIAAGVLWMEYIRSSNKEKEKTNTREGILQTLQDDLEEVKLQSEENRAKLIEVIGLLESLSEGEKNKIKLKNIPSVEPSRISKKEKTEAGSESNSIISNAIDYVETVLDIKES